MPELPEVETVLEGLRPHVENKYIRSVLIRQKQLRWQIPNAILERLPNHKICKLSRRGKYLLFETTHGTAIIHFGMSGSLKVMPLNISPQKHDHFDIIFDDFCLRYTDPRKFGAFLWAEIVDQHPLLAHLGKEPFDKDFTGHYLQRVAANRKVAIKQLIMNSSIVVGVGNIYAAESLFLAKIHPLRPAKDLNLSDFERLAASIKKILSEAIKQGGTTLKDFVSTAGKPGYFKQKLSVYGREGLPCKSCRITLINIRIQNRATVFCPNCQI